MACRVAACKAGGDAYHHVAGAMFDSCSCWRISAIEEVSVADRLAGGQGCAGESSDRVCGPSTSNAQIANWCVWEDAVIAHEALGTPASTAPRPKGEAGLRSYLHALLRPQCVVRRRATTPECPEAQRDPGCSHPRVPRCVRTVVGRLGTRPSVARRPVEAHRGHRSHAQPGNGRRHPGCHRAFRP
jgi:hypothetical protein